MKWIAITDSPKAVRFIIEPEVYTDAFGRDETTLYKISVFENERGVADYQQDSLDQAKGFVMRTYDVPLTAWREIGE